MYYNEEYNLVNELIKSEELSYLTEDLPHRPSVRCKYCTKFGHWHMATNTRKSIGQSQSPMEALLIQNTGYRLIKRVLSKCLLYWLFPFTLTHAAVLLCDLPCILRFNNTVTTAIAIKHWSHIEYIHKICIKCWY